MTAAPNQFASHGERWLLAAFSFWFHHPSIRAIRHALVRVGCGSLLCFPNRLTSFRWHAPSSGAAKNQPFRCVHASSAQVPPLWLLQTAA